MNVKITEATTLAELELARTLLGISSMLSTLTTKDGNLFVEVMCVASDGMVQASGPNLHTAIASAFDKRREQIADLIRTGYKHGGVYR